MQFLTPSTAAPFLVLKVNDRRMCVQNDCKPKVTTVLNLDEVLLKILLALKISLHFYVCQLIASFFLK